MAPAPASKRLAALVTWREPELIAVLGPTGVFVGEVVPMVMGPTGVEVTIGTVCVPEERE